MADTEPNPQDVFDLDRIRQLIELMEKHELGEVDLRQAGQRIRLRRPAAAPPVTYVSAPAVPLPAASAPPPAAHAARPAPAEEETGVVYIKSPMVGTFYSRTNPNAEAYVRVGDRVDENTVVCIIEAMKVFNEIPAEVSGRIVAVLVEDEEPVDFGRPLFKVDTKH